MVLSDKTILNYLQDGGLEIDPFDINRLNPNTVDLTLNSKGLLYKNKQMWSEIFDRLVFMPLDCKQENEVQQQLILENDGLILEPNELYLFSTNEKISINARNICGQICGKSSLGRLGIQIHMTAGFIDTGFSGNITLEITVVKPVIVYANMPICQVRFDKCTESVMNTYKEIKSSKYKNSIGTISSRMNKNF